MRGVKNPAMVAKTARLYGAYTRRPTSMTQSAVGTISGSCATYTWAMWDRQLKLVSSHFGGTTSTFFRNFDLESLKFAH